MMKQYTVLGKRVPRGARMRQQKNARREEKLEGECKVGNENGDKSIIVTVAGLFRRTAMSRVHVTSKTYDTTEF